MIVSRFVPVYLPSTALRSKFQVCPLYILSVACRFVSLCTLKILKEQCAEQAISRDWCLEGTVSKKTKIEVTGANVSEIEISATGKNSREHCSEWEKQPDIERHVHENWSEIEISREKCKRCNAITGKKWFAWRSLLYC